MPPKHARAGDRSILELARQLENGATTARRLVETCVERINDPAGEGARTFRVVNAARAIAEAESMDGLRKAGRAPSPYAGIPISVKDLFDIRGEATLAGSTVLSGRPAATEDAPAIVKLRAAGFVIVGRTNMTEFAYSGVGLNPHYGTPSSPYDRQRGRIPGGSSSGAAVSVADGMAAAGIGTDTGGSCRIPAAMCGTVGFKPTARRISRRRMVPLSFSLDSVGSMANTVTCCALIDSAMADNKITPELPDWPLAAMRIGVLQNLVFGGIEDQVANTYGRALARLSAAGTSLSDLNIPELDELPRINAKGGLASAEAFAWHRGTLATHAGEYDPRVRVRIEAGGRQSAVDYIEVLQQRQRLIDAVDAKTNAFDAVVYPTTPIIPPLLAALEDDAEYARVNGLVLRNPAITNFLDRCAISIPIHEPGDAPVGMNLMGKTLGDRELLALAGSVDLVLAGGG